MKLYLLQAGELFKVGVTSTTVDARIKQLQTGCPRKIHAVCSVELGDDARRVETYLHSMMGDHRTRGEWFDIGPDRAMYLAVMMGVLYGSVLGARVTLGEAIRGSVGDVTVGSQWIPDYLEAIMRMHSRVKTEGSES